MAGAAAIVLPGCGEGTQTSGSGQPAKTYSYPQPKQAVLPAFPTQAPTQDGVTFGPKGAVITTVVTATNQYTPSDLKAALIGMWNAGDLLTPGNNRGATYDEAGANVFGLTYTNHRIGYSLTPSNGGSKVTLWAEDAIPAPQGLDRKDVEEIAKKLPGEYRGYDAETLSNLSEWNDPGNIVS